MKTLKIFIAILATSISFAKAQFTQAEVQVSGLTCSMCSNATEKSLRKLDFISDIKADLNRNLFIITFKKDALVNLDQISKKVQSAGFAVNSLKATISDFTASAGAFIGRNMDRQAAEIQQTVPGATVTREGEGIIVKFDSGILFDVDKTALKAAAKSNLDNLSASLNKNPQTNILIVGHTDSTGSAAHNMDLSIRRAEAVKSLIVADGISGARLSTQGKGKNEPIADNSSADGRAQNRRVEIVIVANEQMKAQAKQQGQ